MTCDRAIWGYDIMSCRVDITPCRDNGVDYDVWPYHYTIANKPLEFSDVVQNTLEGGGLCERSKHNPPWVGPQMTTLFSSKAIMLPIKVGEERLKQTTV